MQQLSSASRAGRPGKRTQCRSERPAQRARGMVLGEARRPLPCTHGSRREGRAAAADNVSTRGTAETQRLRAKSWPDPPWAGGYSVSLLGGSPDPPWAGGCSISLSGGSPDPPWAGRCSISLLGRSPDPPWAGGCSISLVGRSPGVERAAGLEGAAFHSRVLPGGSPDTPWAGGCGISLAGRSPDPPWAGGCRVSLPSRSPWGAAC